MISHGCTGSHTGAVIGNGWIWTSANPIDRNLSASHAADSSSPDDSIVSYRAPSERSGHRSSASSILSTPPAGGTEKGFPAPPTDTTPGGAWPTPTALTATNM